MDYLLSNEVEFVTADQFTATEVLGLHIKKDGAVNCEIGLNAINGDFVKCKLENFYSFWYRRGRFQFADSETLQKHYRLEREIEIIHQIVLKESPFKTTLGCYYFERNVNKLEMLIRAKESGFDIPETFVSVENNALKTFLKERDCINKPIKTIKPCYNEKELTFNSKVARVSEIDNRSFPFPLLFQESINKVYELRIVVVKDKIYAMCIFSQISEKGELDFREDYDGVRMTPYLLNEEEEAKIRDFMIRINQDSGSIDLIKNDKGELIFLEINPSGQYDFVSKICNYNIDFEIAKQISKSFSPEANNATTVEPKTEKVRYSNSECAFIQKYNLELSFIDPFYKNISRCT